MYKIILKKLFIFLMNIKKLFIWSHDLTLKHQVIIQYFYSIVLSFHIMGDLTKWIYSDTYYFHVFFIPPTELLNNFP